jgi:hypothetical protein
MSDRKDRRGSQDESTEGELPPLSAFLPGIMEGIKLAPSPRPETSQGRHHYTTIKQIEELQAIPQDSPEMGFMTRLLTLCSLPRTDPKELKEYVRRTGPYVFGMTAGVQNRLPYGNLPRLLLAWMCTEAVKTQNRELQLGHSLAEFMRQLGMLSDSGGSRADRTRLRNQIDRLFNAHVQLISETPGRKRTISSTVADETDLWWDYKSPTQDTLWQSRVMLGERLFQEIIAHPVPLDMRILKAMRRSSLGLDLYMWLSYKTFTLLTATGPKTQRLSWHQIYSQFGKDPDKAHDKDVVNDFRKDALRELRKLRLCWPTLDFKTPKGFLEIRGCMPSIPPKAIGNNEAGKLVKRG